MYVGPALGTPIMRSLYQMPRSASTPNFMATNSAPKSDDSIVGCFCESNLMRDMFKKIENPVCEHQSICSLHGCYQPSCTDLPLFQEVVGHLLEWPLGRPHRTLPIMMLKSGVINMRVSGVKNKSRVVLQPEITHITWRAASRCPSCG
jgi:hypothetical protein